MRREQVAHELGNRVHFVRRSFLLLPGTGERAVHDDYVISHRIAAARQEPELGFTIPAPGTPYPRSSLPAQLVAIRTATDLPERLASLEARLYHAVFVRLEDVADPSILRRCAEAAGVPPELVDRALADPELRHVAFREHQEALDQGIEGVPALLIPGEPPIVGAVPLETYRRALYGALGLRLETPAHARRRLPRVS